MSKQIKGGEMTFKEEINEIMMGVATERQLNAIESVHRRHRNFEINERAKTPPNNSAFSRALEEVAKHGHYAPQPPKLKEGL